MAVYPFVVHRTFIAGVTQLPAADINDIEYYTVGQYAGFEKRDEFAGAAIDGFWTQVALGTGTVLSIVDDSAAGGRGSVSFLNGTAGTRECTLKSAVLAVGTSDFVFRCRVRRVSTAINLIVGIGDPGTTNPGCVFRMNSGSGSWDASPINSNGTTGASSTGIAHATTYQTLVIIRKSGVVTFYVDGVQGYTAANTTNFATVRLMLTQLDNQNFETRIDNVFFWAA